VNSFDDAVGQNLDKAEMAAWVSLQILHCIAQSRLMVGTSVATAFHNGHKFSHHDNFEVRTLDNSRFVSFIP
jgi:hypothetical protein